MKYAKAYLGAVIAGLTAIATGMTDNVLTGAEWIAAAIATLTALGAVAGIPNKTP